MKKINAGIYVIQFDGCNRFYIGSSNNLEKRKYYHFRMLKNNKHTNQHLQNAFNKYGEDSLKFSTIVICDNNREYLFLLEQRIIDAYDFNELFNIAKIVGRPDNKRYAGRKFTQEDVEKIFNLSAEGKSNSYIAKVLNTNKSNIQKIITRNTYFDIDIDKRIIELAQNTMNANRVNIFNKDEIQIIKDNYNKITKDELSKILGRHKNTIFPIANRLGLINKTWTKKVDNFIIENYQKLGRSECAKQLGISTTLLSSRVHTLKIKGVDIRINKVNSTNRFKSP